MSIIKRELYNERIALLNSNYSNPIKKESDFNINESIKKHCTHLKNIILHIQSVSTKDLLFKDVIEMWLKNNQIRYKGATLIKYRNLIDTHIMPDLGDIKVRELNSTLINSYLSDKLNFGRINGENPLSSSYIRSITVVINSIISFAVKEQFCKPLKTPVYKPNIIKKDLVILDLVEQRHLEIYLTENLSPTHVGILLSLYTGMRIGEVCALSWEDIDFENKIITVRHTIARVRKNQDSKETHLILDRPKTNASIRDIPIPSKLMEILIKSKQISKSKFLISTNDHFVSPRTYEYRYHQVLLKCKIKSINYHALRHTFATRCIEAGVDIKSLSEILGHASVNVTLNTYVHSSMEMKRKELEKLNNL